MRTARKYLRRVLQVPRLDVSLGSAQRRGHQEQKTPNSYAGTSLERRTWMWTKTHCCKETNNQSQVTCNETQVTNESRTRVARPLESPALLGQWNVTKREPPDLTCPNRGRWEIGSMLVDCWAHLSIENGSGHLHCLGGRPF